MSNTPLYPRGSSSALLIFVISMLMLVIFSCNFIDAVSETVQLSVLSSSETQSVGQAFMDVDVWVVGVRIMQQIQSLPGLFHSAICSNAWNIIPYYSRHWWFIFTAGK